MNILSHFDIKTFLETNLEWPIIIIKAFFGCEPQMGYYFYIIFFGEFCDEPSINGI
jgi:hypothetical protein